jgi:serine/threonine-protein kinase HipA
MRRLEVRLDWGEEEVRAGTLAERDRRIYFEYDGDFLEGPLSISPFKLPPRPGLLEETERAFGGLFGVFNDSLPDGWGLLLMDRQFKRRGNDPARVSPLDRLAYIGTRAMGALTYHPPTGVVEEPLEIDLGVVSRQAERILEGSVEDVLPELLIAGGSPGGARPKVLVGFHEENGHVISGTSDLPEGYRHYIVKFGTKEDGPDIGAVERAYALMAGEAGVTMPRTRLFETRDGGRYFGAERFDRDGNARFHVHTLGGLLHASHRWPSLEYDSLLKVTRELTKDQRQVEEAFRRMAVNVFAHNRDDHVKNFSFVMQPDGRWDLSPAYDVVFSEGMNGWHSMAVAGEAEKPTEADMLTVGEECGVEQGPAKEILTQVRAAVGRWERFARQTDVSRQRTRKIGKVIAGVLST